MPAGRPSGFTQEIADSICDRIGEGESLNAICREDGMPSMSMVFRWLSDRAEFRDQYARAREIQAERMAAEIVSIADTEEDPARARNRIDARKWTASKLLPKVYGDRQALDVDIKHSFAELTDSELASELARLAGQTALLPSPGDKSQG